MAQFISVATGFGVCFSLKPCSSSNRNSSSVGSNRNSSSVESGDWGATGDTMPSLQSSHGSGNYVCNGGSRTSRSCSSHPRPPSSNSKQHFGPGRCCGSFLAASSESGEPGVLGSTGSSTGSSTSSSAGSSTSSGVGDARCFCGSASDVVGKSEADAG